MVDCEDLNYIIKEEEQGSRDYREKATELYKENKGKEGLTFMKMAADEARHARLARQMAENRDCKIE